MMKMFGMLSDSSCAHTKLYFFFSAIKHGIRFGVEEYLSMVQYNPLIEFHGRHRQRIRMMMMMFFFCRRSSAKMEN